MCSRASVGLTPLCFLWQRDQAELLAEMLRAPLDAVLVKVAALGLSPRRDVGRPLAELAPAHARLHARHGLHVCGEGGEYETLALDMPLFASTLVLDETETVVFGSGDAGALRRALPRRAQARGRRRGRAPPPPPRGAGDAAGRPAPAVAVPAHLLRPPAGRRGPRAAAAASAARGRVDVAAQAHVGTGRRRS